ncbi:MAG: alpha/beta fold hydrolase [Candidatus Rifleibacteriota bacterium]
MAFNPQNFTDLYPFSQNYFIQPDGFKQHYVDEGKGEPLIMVHGNPSWSFLYRDMIKEFKPAMRTIAPDHIGCGLSEKPGTDKFPYQLKDHIDNLERLIDSLNLKQPVNLAVHDWGGAIGMGYATRNPDKIKRIIVMNTAAFRLPQDCPFPWPIWLFRNTKIGEFLNNKFNAFALIASYSCAIKGLSPKVREGFLAPYDSAANRVATTRFVQDIPLVETDPSYDELLKIENNLENLKHKPMLICFGRKDFVFNRHFFHEWKKRFPQARAHSFHAGHYLLEDVGPRVFSIMKNFFERQS